MNLYQIKELAELFENHIEVFEYFSVTSDKPMSNDLRIELERYKKLILEMIGAKQ